MKLARIALIAGALTLISSAQALTLAVWNFNDSVAAAADLTVDRQLSGVNATLTSEFASPTNPSFTGTTVNADSGDVAGLDCAFQNGTNGANNGKSIVFQLNSTGYDTLALSYAFRRSSTGFTDFDVYTSTDGASYTLFGNVANTDTAYGTAHTIDLSGVSAIQNTSAAYVKFTFNGGSTSSSAGNNRFDNIVISGSSAVPEPTSMVLLGLGLAGFVARKRKNA